MTRTRRDATVEANGTAAPLLASELRRLPHHVPGGESLPDRDRGWGLLLLCGPSSQPGSLRKPRMPRVLRHAESLSPDRRGADDADLEGSSSIERESRPSVQSIAQTHRASLSGPISRSGHPRRRALRQRVRIRLEQPRAVRAVRRGARMALEWADPTLAREPAIAQAPKSRSARPRRRGRSTAGSRARARPASACGSASSPRR